MLAHRRLGDFEIIRPLGQGGMGEVYEAQQLNPQRRVALKVLAPWLSTSPEALERFWREAAVPAQLDHPNIVRIIATGKTEDGVAYYTMQFVRGISLAELIRRAREPALPATVPMPTVANAANAAAETPSHVQRESGPPPAVLPNTPPPILEEYVRACCRTAARLGIQAARALADAHRQGFLHRDIKPSNMMVDHHGHLYLLDFGLTRACDPGPLGTRPGTVLGTPLFMSPEQARGEKVDQRSDLYSLGVTLYQLLTRGSGPFPVDGNDSEQVLECVRRGRHVPLGELAPQIPAELTRIIARAMHFRPQRRYQNGKELADDLEAFVDESREKTSGARSGRSRKKAVFSSLATVTVLLMIAVAFFLWRQEPADRGASRPAPGPGIDSQPAFPAFLANRPVNVRVPLLRDDFSPIWHHRLLGSGTIQPLAPFQLQLTSVDATLIALDHDPKERPFEFTVELSTPATKAGDRWIGAFFGWRRSNERKEAARYFRLEINERSNRRFPAGAYVLDFVRLEGLGTVDRVAEQSTSLVRRGLKTAGWHEVSVRATEHEIVLSVDRDRVSISKKQFVDSLPPGSDVEMNPRGALGIWATHNDHALFRKASIKTLQAND